jgi:RHS repeat-associated protein
MFHYTPVDYLYGINGSLRCKLTYATETGQPREEFYLFDAYGNMNVYCDNRETYAYYGYDDDGQRTYKMQMYNTNVNTNNYGFSTLQMDKITFYPNGFMNMNQNGEYTKHYYAETQRIASKIGTGSVLADNLCDNLDGRYNVAPHELDNLRYQIEDKTQRDLTFTPIPGTWVEIVPIWSNICELPGDGANYEYDLCFYHGNHLSSTQMVTDMYGGIVQQVHYAPFGEIISESNAYWHQGRIPDYLFNGKELDEESGMYYYEARYYNPNLSIFISRDQLFEKYPFMSPYSYCSNNPVNRIDPTGMEDDWYQDSKTGATFWKAGNAPTAEKDGVTYNNIGETHSNTVGNTTFNYTQNEITSMTTNVMSESDFISQFSKSDWNGTPANQACNKASDAMLNGVNAVSGGMDVIVNNGSDGRAGTANGRAATAIDKMSNNLDFGLPTKINIDYKAGQSSSDKMGDHFMVVMGKTENISNGGRVTSTSFRYFDPGTRSTTKGTSTSNILNVIGGRLTGTHINNSSTIIGTSIRQSRR